MRFKEFPREDDEEKTLSLFNECPFRACLKMESAILTRCPRPPGAHMIEKFRPTVTDYLNIRECKKGEEGQKGLQRYMNNNLRREHAGIARAASESVLILYSS
jgi:hypothetical protein